MAALQKLQHMISNLISNTYTNELKMDSLDSAVLFARAKVGRQPEHPVACPGTIQMQQTYAVE